MSRPYTSTPAMEAACRARSEAVWPADKIAQLTELYVDEGLTHAAISRRMGLTKNMIIGKVTRLGLTRGAGFVPSALQLGQMKAADHRAPPTTLLSRLDALHAAFDAILATNPPPRIPDKPPALLMLPELRRQA